MSTLPEKYKGLHLKPSKNLEFYLTQVYNNWNVFGTPTHPHTCNYDNIHSRSVDTVSVIQCHGMLQAMFNVRY